MRKNNFGESLKARRKEKGLTLVELEALSGVETSYLGRIEQGLRFPSAHILRKMAEPLGYGEAEILKLAGYLSPDKTDDRIAIFKESMKGEIRQSMSNLLEKVDTLSPHLEEGVEQSDKGHKRTKQSGASPATKKSG